MLALSAVPMQSIPQVAFPVALGADTQRSLGSQSYHSMLLLISILGCKLISPYIYICDALVDHLTPGNLIFSPHFLIFSPVLGERLQAFESLLQSTLNRSAEQPSHLVPVASCLYVVSFGSLPSSMHPIYWESMLEI